MHLNRQIPPRRRDAQSGLEAIEFALFFMLVFPPLMWMFINGMNFIRLDKANDVTRAAGLMYIKGQDFTQVGTQNIIALVANGMDLQVGTAGGASGSTSGSGLIVFSTVQYIGPTTCSNCANVNHYVFLSRIYVGNTNLQFNGATVQSSLGSPSSSLWSSTTGAVSSSQSNTGAQLSSSFANFGTSNGQPVRIGDSQIVYVTETFFAPLNSFGSGLFSSGGVYVRALM